MASIESRALADLYRSWNDLRARNNNDPLAYLRLLFTQWGDVGAEARGVWFETVDGPVPGLRAVPPEFVSGGAALFLHGGGYIAGGSGSHRKLAAHYARAIGVPVFVPDYRLAPEHRFPAQLEDARRAFDWLVDCGYAPSDVVLLGDSAGGALATALASQLRDEGEPMPAAVVALSPYYDVETVGRSFDRNAQRDAMVGARGREGIAANVAMFVADDNQRIDPYVSALRNDLTGLPPHFLSVGEAEVLVDGVELFAQRARAAGVEVELEVVEDMQHVFQFLAGRAPEADVSIAAAALFVRRRLTDTRGQTLAPVD